MRGSILHNKRLELAVFVIFSVYELGLNVDRAYHGILYRVAKAHHGLGYRAVRAYLSLGQS